MAIESRAFGSVTLTKGDAAKFLRQVQFGRATDAAKATVRRGMDMITEFRSSGGKLEMKAVRRKQDNIAG